MPAKLSVNINKYALLRNSRGGHHPDLLQVVDCCLDSGVHGITVHPRRDQRHIRFDDLPKISGHLTDHPDIEFNIECELHPYLLDLLHEIAPHQCTLVPVTPGELTSDHGWDLPTTHRILRPAVERLQQAGIRVSIFMDCEPSAMAMAADVGVDRVELYTGPFAQAFGTTAQARETDRLHAAAKAAHDLGIGVNAGHDLDRHNLPLMAHAAGLLEVSIGHAQICRALDVGTRQSIGELLSALGW